MYGVVWSACISGSHIKVFGRMLGFNEFAFGLMAAVPFLATFAQVFATIIIERTGLTKYQFIYCGVINRLLWLGIALIPLLLPMPSNWAVAAMMVCLLVSSLAGSLSTPAGLTWMGDLIPRRIRGRYWANRIRLTRIVMILVVIFLGILLDAVSIPGASETAAAQPVLLKVICVIFAASAVFGVIDVLMFLKIRQVMPTVSCGAQPPTPPQPQPAPRRWTPFAAIGYLWRALTSTCRHVLLDPLKDKGFRHAVGFGMAIAFTITVSSWYYWLQAMEVLGFDKLGANFLFLVVGPVTGIFAARALGRLVDLMGRRPVLILAVCGTVLSTLAWFFVTRDTPSPAWMVTSVNALAGWCGSLFGRPGLTWLAPGDPVGAYLAVSLATMVGASCWMAINLAQTGIVLGFADGHGRSKFVAAFSVLISIGGILGGLVGGTVAQSLNYLKDTPIGPFQWNNHHATFILSILSSIVAVIWLIRMPDPGAKPVRDVLRYVRFNAYNAVATRLFYRLRIFGWGRARKNKKPSKPARTKRRGKQARQ